MAPLVDHPSLNVSSLSLFSYVDQAYKKELCELWNSVSMKKKKLIFFFILQAYKNQGQMFKDSGIPIYGLGVQSHFHSLPGSIDVLKVSVIFLYHLNK